MHAPIVYQILGRAEVKPWIELVNDSTVAATHRRARAGRDGGKGGSELAAMGWVAGTNTHDRRGKGGGRATKRLGRVQHLSRGVEIFQHHEQRTGHRTCVPHTIESNRPNRRAQRHPALPAGSLALPLLEVVFVFGQNLLYFHPKVFWATDSGKRKCHTV